MKTSQESNFETMQGLRLVTAFRAIGDPEIKKEVLSYVEAKAHRIHQDNDVSSSQKVGKN